MHKVQVNRLGGLSLPRKSVVRLTDRPEMTLDVYRGRKTTIQQQQQYNDVEMTSYRRRHDVVIWHRRQCCAFDVVLPLGQFRQGDFSFLLFIPQLLNQSAVVRALMKGVIRLLWIPALKGF